MRRRKPLLLAFISSLFFLTPAFGVDYVIKLKNGRSLVSPKYWEEKGFLKFYWAGGVAGISKEEVLSVKRMEDDSGEGVSYLKQRPAPPPKEEKAGTAALAEKDPKAGAAAGEKIDPAHYKKQKALYTKLYEEAYERYLAATSAKDEQEKKKAWEEFNRFGGQVITLQEEVKGMNKGVLPKWWNE